LSANVLLDSGDVLLAGEDLVPDLAAGAADTGSATLMIPAATAPGTYYIFAKADADNVVLETKETNNTLSRTFQIGAELAVSAFTVPPKGGAGISLTVSDTTVNSGGGSAAPTSTKFYLSANTVLDVNDALVGSRAIPELGAGATSTGTTIVTIPPNILAGSYYLVAKADADAVVAETQETNNTFARAILIGSDLLVSVIGAPAKGGAGQSIIVTETIANQGGGGATASVTRFYLSANASLDAADVLLEGSRAVADVAPGASSAGSTSVRIPQGVVAGTFYIIAKADAENAVGETLETNNTRAQSIVVGPDLIVSSAVVAPASAPVGASITVTETVSNQGAGMAGATTTRFYLSKNGALDASDVVFASGRSVPDLAAGASSAGMTPLTIPPGTVPGTYYVLARADGDGVEGETVETNNVTARLLQVTVAP
jgi:subtilase family serine protease